MAISYMGKAGAKAMLKKDLTSALFGNPELASATEMIEYVAKVREWSRASRTAQAIFAVIDRSERDIFVVGMKRGGFSCFSSSAPGAVEYAKFYGTDPKVEKRSSNSAQLGGDDEIAGMITTSGVVYFDIEAKFSFKERAGLDANRNIVYKDAENELHPYVAFLHELGHAKQFIENPLFFEGSLWNKASLANDLENQLRAIVQKGIEKAEGTAPAAPAAAPAGAASGGEARGMPPPPPPMAMRNGPGPASRARDKVHKDHKLGAHSAGVMRNEDGTVSVARNIPKKASRPAWAVRIEADNMVSHEWPICDEMGQPKRMTYSEISLL